MRVRALLALAVPCLACLASCATVRRPLPPAEPLRYQGYFATYPTGLRLVAFQIAGVTRATVTASYAAGTNDEPPGKEGVARVALALTERSSHQPGGFTIGERLFALGVHTHVELREDDVEFRTIARSASLDAVIAAEADRLREPLAGVTQSDFDEERETLARELELGTSDDGAATALGTLWQRLFAGTRHGRTPPTPASVRAISFQDVQEWLATALAPERGVLVVTAPDDATAVGGRVVSKFGSLAAPGAGSGAPAVPFRHAPPEPLPDVRDGDALEELRADARWPTLWVGWALPGDGAGIAALEDMRTLLENVLQARVAREDLSERIDGVRVAVDRSMGAALLHAVVRLRSAEDADRVRDAITGAAVLDDGPSAVNAWVWARWRRGRAGNLGVLFAATNGVPDGARLVRALGLVDPLAARREQSGRADDEAFIASYREHVRKTRRVSLLVVPRASDAHAVDLSSEPRWSLRADRLAVAAPGSSEVLALVQGPELGRATRTRLANGLEVVVVPRGELPLVEAHLVIRPDAPDATAWAASRFLALALAKKEWTPAEDWECWAPPMGLIGQSLVARELTPAAHVRRGLENLSCWTRRRFDGAHHFEARKFLRAVAERLHSDPAARATGEFVAAAYGEAHRVPPVPAAVAKTDRADAERFMAEQFRPDRALLVVVGKIEADPALLAEIERCFGKWRRSEVPATLARRPEPRARTVTLVDAPGARRVRIHLGARLPPRDRADIAAERVLAKALQLALERRALPGGIALARVGGLPDDPVLEALLVVDPGSAGTATREALGALAELASAPLSTVDVNLLRWLVARDEAFQFDTVHGLAQAAELTFVQGLPLDAWDALPASLASVDASRLQAAARAALVGREVVVITGDASAIGPVLEGAGLGYALVRPKPAR